METNFKTRFYDVTNSKFFLQNLKQLNLESYSLEILSYKHRNEAIDLLCDANGKSSDNHGSIIFNISPIDMEPYCIAIVDHALRTELSFVCLDRDKKLAAVVIQYDIVDKFQIDLNTLPMNVLKQFEMKSKRNECNDFISAIESNVKYGLITRGDCLKLDMDAVRSDLQGRGLSLLVFVAYELLFVMDWKWMIGCVSHPSTVHSMLHKMPAFFNMKLNNVSNDEENVCCFVSYFNIYPYMKMKFKNDEWFNKNLNREWTLNYCKSLKMGCQIINCDKLRKKYKYNAEQFWVQFVQAMFIHGKNYKSQVMSKL